MARRYKNPLCELFGREFFLGIPKNSGVYFMRDENNKILYIGKATNLRARIKSYCYARPANVGPNIIKMIARLRRIDWELHENETMAWERELLLIRALVPPYNIENAWRERYFFIAIRNRGTDRIEFQLSASDKKISEDYEIHGCYPLRRRVKQGYSSLLRILHAISQNSGRFSYPAKLARPVPCYQYSLKVAQARRWRSQISEFLHGESAEFLPKLVIAMLENLNIPEYVRPGLQRDLNSLKVFEEACLLSKKLRRLQSSESGYLTHRQMRRRIRDSVQVETIAGSTGETKMAEAAVE